MDNTPVENLEQTDLEKQKREFQHEMTEVYLMLMDEYKNLMPKNPQIPQKMEEALVDFSSLGAIHGEAVLNPALEHAIPFGADFKKFKAIRGGAISPVFRQRVPGKADLSGVKTIRGKATPTPALKQKVPDRADFVEFKTIRSGGITPVLEQKVPGKADLSGIRAIHGEAVPTPALKQEVPNGADFAEFKTIHCGEITSVLEQKVPGKADLSGISAIHRETATTPAFKQKAPNGADFTKFKTIRGGKITPVLEQKVPGKADLSSIKEVHREAAPTPAFKQKAPNGADFTEFKRIRGGAISPVLEQDVPGKADLSGIRVIHRETVSTPDLKLSGVQRRFYAFPSGRDTITAKPVEQRTFRYLAKAENTMSNSGEQRRFSRVSPIPASMPKIVGWPDGSAVPTVSENFENEISAGEPVPVMAMPVPRMDIPVHAQADIRASNAVSQLQPIPMPWEKEASRVLALLQKVKPKSAERPVARQTPAEVEAHLPDLQKAWEDILSTLA